MPSKTPAQRRLMMAAATNPHIAKKTDVPPKVARDFVAADKRQLPGVFKSRGARRS